MVSSAMFAMQKIIVIFLTWLLTRIYEWKPELSKKRSLEFGSSIWRDAVGGGLQGRCVRKNFNVFRKAGFPKILSFIVNAIDNFIYIY